MTARTFRLAGLAQRLGPPTWQSPRGIGRSDRSGISHQWQPNRCTRSRVRIFVEVVRTDTRCQIPHLTRTDPQHQIACAYDLCSPALGKFDLSLTYAATKCGVLITSSGCRRN